MEVKDLWWFVANIEIVNRQVSTDRRILMLLEILDRYKQSIYSQFIIRNINNLYSKL